MLISKALTVGDTKTLILEADARRESVLIRNMSSLYAVRIGGEDLTYDQGTSILPEDAISLELNQFMQEAEAAVYGMCTPGQSARVEVLYHKT